MRHDLAWCTLRIEREPRREDLVTAENTPDPTAPDTIVLIHGFWMTPRSWEKWVEH
jgi:pimeloyl-ACP methyl ester carboxylesterase